MTNAATNIDNLSHYDLALQRVRASTHETRMKARLLARTLLVQPEFSQYCTYTEVRQQTATSRERSTP